MLRVPCFYPQRVGGPVLRKMTHSTHAWIIPAQPPFGFLSSSSDKLYLLYLWLGSRGFLTASWLPGGQVVVGYLLTTSPLGEGFGEKGSTLQDHRKQDLPLPHTYLFSLIFQCHCPPSRSLAEDSPECPPMPSSKPTLPWLFPSPHPSPKTTAISPRQLPVIQDCPDLTFSC